MIKKLAVGVAALATVLGGVAAALPASAQTGTATKAGQVLNLRENGYGGCQKPGSTWGVNGAEAVLTITDKLNFPNKQSLYVSSSNSDAVNTGCLNGYAYSGGTKRLTSSWTVGGTEILSCSIGIGGNCTVSSTEKSATDTYDTGTKPNNDGEWSVSSGGGRVTTEGTLGKVDYYRHKSTATFAAGSKATIATAENYAVRKF
ncbi:hypothetical protein E1263_16015 [Kribbella antibiotica]|uniref:Uncharacterized protein n=1 Tax=Kribbella antibiotica TaxID=190195 RepID=A0A4R4ZN59_9ACTN|nr:hypothetical protein [Kribbella antibiotica]TDD59159.1 hypothetical protein E1263_16015 [Kribbella antibiotica]